MNEIRVTISRTINTGNYESFKLELSESIPVEQEVGDPMCTVQLQELSDTLFEVCKQKVKEYKRSLNPIKRSKNGEEER